jgi:rod shape-determining protein MreD
MTLRAVALAVVGALVALVLQTTLFGRLAIGGVAPDVVLITILLFAVRSRSEPAILFAFGLGLVFDALSVTALGLRAGIYSAVAFLAIRTIARMDSNPFSVAAWMGLMTLAGVVLFLVVGTIFGQVNMDAGEAMRRIILVPIYNLALAVLLAPLSARLLAPSRRGFL